MGVRFLMAMLVLGGVWAEAAGPAEDVVKGEVDRVMTAWHHAAAVADGATYFGTLAPGAIFIGTDAKERWTKEELETWAAPYFKRDSAWVFRATQRDVYLSPDGATAWFDELLDSKSYWPTRGSGVLSLIDGKWLLRQYVMSFTIPNDSVKEIKPIVLKAFEPAK